MSKGTLTVRQPSGSADTVPGDRKRHKTLPITARGTAFGGGLIGATGCMIRVPVGHHFDFTPTMLLLDIFYCIGDYSHGAPSYNFERGQHPIQSDSYWLYRREKAS